MTNAYKVMTYVLVTNYCELAHMSNYKQISICIHRVKRFLCT